MYSIYFHCSALNVFTGITLLQALTLIHFWAFFDILDCSCVLHSYHLQGEKQLHST